MVTSPPPLLLLLLALAAASALGLAWVIRADWSARGRLQPWRLVEGVLGLFLMLAMLFATSIQVLARYALADLVTVPWTEELARLLLVWAAFWGAAMLQRSDDHISMTVVFDWLPRSAQLGARLLGDVVTLALLALVAWHGWRTALRQMVMSTVSLGLPISVFILPVALAASLMIAHTVVVMVRRVRGGPVREGAGTEV
jgi:TRAP-type C4-dicarboxylate transport system permease small subunit